METENLALREFIKENLRKGYIQPLQLLVGYLVLFIPKKNGKLRMCINYRQLNSIIKKGLISTTINFRDLRQNR